MRHPIINSSRSPLNKVFSDMGHDHPVLVVLAAHDWLYHVHSRIQAVLEYCKSVLFAIFTHVTEERCWSQPRPVKIIFPEYETILRVLDRFLSRKLQNRKYLLEISPPNLEASKTSMATDFRVSITHSRQRLKLQDMFWGKAGPLPPDARLVV